jgi:biopolymer transport protein ExbB/TolQ
MDIQSFAFGMLAALGLLTLVAIVVGLFKVYKHGIRLDSTEENMNHVERSINDRMDHENRELNDRIDRMLDELLKRIEVGEAETLNKVNRNIDRNENLLSNKIAELRTRVHELAIYQDLEHHKLNDLGHMSVQQINS